MRLLIKNTLFLFLLTFLQHSQKQPEWDEMHATDPLRKAEEPPVYLRRQHYHWQFRYKAHHC